MLIISSLKHEGVFNLDFLGHLCVEELMANDGEKLYSIRITGTPGLPEFIGGWKTRNKAEKELDRIVRAYHLGLKDVELEGDEYDD
jgi:hypothetical protein